MAKMTYINFQQLSDVLVAEKFQGLPPRAIFTEEDWYMIRNSQKIAGVKTFDNYSRRLFVSRFLEGPLAALAERVSDLLANNTSRDTLRYYLDSAHDTHVVALLLWLQAANNDFIDAPFSSSVFFELHYDSECLAAKRDFSCFTIEIYSNGQLLKLPSCLKANKERGSTSPVCQYEDFVRDLRQKMLRGDLEELCNQGFNPYPQNAR